MPNVVCASGDADPQLTRFGQVCAYVRLLAEAYNCTKTQPRFCDGASCAWPVLFMALQSIRKSVKF